MLSAVLGDLQTEVGGVYNTLLYAFDFVSEYKGVFGAAEGGTGLRGYTPDRSIQLYRIFRLFDCDYRVAFCLKGSYSFEGVREVSPRNGLFGSEGGFMDFGRRGHGADSAEVNPAGAERIGAAESASHVVCAAYVVEYHYGSGGVAAAVFFR